jgi:membrane protein DedA with SNARE-associated domain
MSMTALMDFLLGWLETISTKVPTSWFVMIGAFLEEVVAPIPSPFVMTMAGTLSKAAGDHFMTLIYLAIIGAFAKTVASWIIYVVSDKAEDIVIGKFGKMIGISHKEVEKMGGYLNKGKRDWIVMLLLRAVPIIPTSPISVLSGVLKINMVVYSVTTLVGYAIRNLFYLYFGYTSLEAAQDILGGLDQAETLAKVIIVLLLGIAIVWFYIQRQKENSMQNMLNKFMGMFKKQGKKRK